MPSYRHREMQDLYIRFTVKFPDTLPEQSFALLEQALPPRVEPSIPKKGYVEDVYLSDVDHAHQARKEDAMDEDEDEGQAGPGVQVRYRVSLSNVAHQPELYSAHSSSRVESRDRGSSHPSFRSGSGRNNAFAVNSILYTNSSFPVVLIKLPCFDSTSSFEAVGTSKICPPC